MLKLKSKSDGYARIDWKESWYDQHVQRGGQELPCTVLEVGPCVVTQVKTADKDGYDAVQVGFGDRKAKPDFQGNGRPL